MKNKKIMPFFLFSMIFSAVGSLVCGDPIRTVFASESQAVNTDANTLPQILKNAELIDENGVLSYIPNSIIEENLMQDIAFFQDSLLSSYSVYDAETGFDRLHLRLLDLDSGELLYEMQLQTGNSYVVNVQACGDRIVVSDVSNGIIHIFDDTLNEQNQYAIENDIIYNNIYVDPSVTKAYCLTSADGIYAIDLETKERQILLENTADLSFYSRSEDDLSIRYIDLATPDKKECYAGLDLKTGTIEKFEIDDSFSGLEYLDGIWTGQILSDDDPYQYLLGTQDELYKFDYVTSYPVMRLTGKFPYLTIMTTGADGIQSMSAYKTDGTFLSSFSLKDSNQTLTWNQAWMEDMQGCFITMIDESGHDELYFWDLTKNVAGESLQLSSYSETEELGGEILPQEYYDRAKNLSEKYGIHIKIADQCATDHGDKTAQQESDPDKVSAGLTALEKALSSYPDGFFEQLYYGAYRTIEINLMGEIVNKEEIEGYSPTAFVQHENGKIKMVLNIDTSSDILEQNFYHESSHMIDKVLEHDALYREDALYSEEMWASFNPEEFISLNPENGGYFGSYEIMPMEYFQEAFTPYFVSDYGKSFSTEDRATIFENAMLGNTQIFSRNVSEALNRKLEYYCKCIRDCFDTTGWPEHTAWECM